MSTNTVYKKIKRARLLMLSRAAVLAIVGTVLALCCPSQKVCASDEGKKENVTFSVPTEYAVYQEFCESGIHYLFLPSEVSPQEVTIEVKGSTFVESEIGRIQNNGKQLIIDASDDPAFYVELADRKQEKICVMCSDLPSLRIALKGVNIWEIQKGSTDVKYPGNEVVFSVPGREEYSFFAPDVEVKGRGNYTWCLSKRPYQIKFSESTDICGMGAAKKWVLLANYDDDSLMKNKLAFEMARDLGLLSTPNAMWVDLFIDGMYQGNYLLSEKVEIGENRCDLSDPQGILVELDNMYYEDEKTVYTSEDGNHYVLKDSVADDEGEDDSIAESSMIEFGMLMDQVERELKKENPDWKILESALDMDSFVEAFFVQEMSKDWDSMKSSLYLYRDGPSDKIHMGPAWDFGFAFGAQDQEDIGARPEGLFFLTIADNSSDYALWMTELLGQKTFDEMLEKFYRDKAAVVFSENIDRINEYEKTLTKSASMNFIVWDKLGKPSVLPYGRPALNSYEEEVDFLRSWISDRNTYMDVRFRISYELLKRLGFRTEV